MEINKEDTNKEDINKKIEECNEELENCPICYEELGQRDICITKCGHKYCMSCLFKHAEKSLDCPMCRTKIVDREENNRSRQNSLSNEQIMDMVNNDMSIDVDYMDQLLRSTTLPEMGYNSNNMVTTTDSGLEIIHSEDAFPSLNLNSSRIQVDSLISSINQESCYEDISNNYVDLTNDITLS